MNIRIATSKEIDELLLKVFGYQDEISDDQGGWIPNPETGEEFIIRTTEDFLKNSIRGFWVEGYSAKVYSEDVDLGGTATTPTPEGV